MLYEDIVKEYGENWFEEELDIDLPFVISKKKSPEKLRYKNDFTNILLVFDYERHDTYFSELKIVNMQKKFIDAADMGKLYINYPMVESYQHLKTLPDKAYRDRKIPVSLQPGKKYKQLIAEESMVCNMVDFPHRIDDVMKKQFGMINDTIRKKCCNDILNISSDVDLIMTLESILSDALEWKKMETLKYQMKVFITAVGYARAKKTYWEFLRNYLEISFFIISVRQIGFKITCMMLNILSIKKSFEQINLMKILEKQNDLSRDHETGYIWVLNTCVFFIADYRFSLLQ